MAINLNDKDHVFGAAEAPVILVEYGDFQDPHCAVAYVYLKEIKKEMGEGMKFVYRHFPVIEYHLQTELAAEASECAAAQEKFWLMHDMLFEHQNALEENYLVRYAREIGLDVPRFREDLRTHVFRKRVDEDAISGEENGVGNTPTFFINGEIYEGERTKENLAKAINSLL